MLWPVTERPRVELAMAAQLAGRCCSQPYKCCGLEYCSYVSQPPEEAGAALAHAHDMDGAALVAPGDVPFQLTLQQEHLSSTQAQICKKKALN